MSNPSLLDGLQWVLATMRRGSNRRVAGELSISCTIDRASSSIIKLVFPRVDTKINPSLKAHCSAICS